MNLTTKNRKEIYEENKRRNKGSTRWSSSNKTVKGALIGNVRTYNEKNTHRNNLKNKIFDLFMTEK